MSPAPVRSRAHMITDSDLRLIPRGHHRRLWQVLGAHAAPGGGVSFAVWAPHARQVWVCLPGGEVELARRDEGEHSTGVWEVFVPSARAGDRYTLRLLGSDGRWRRKADPMAREGHTPASAESVVPAPAGYEWGDENWMARRGGVQAPMTVYEVHLGSWREGADYRRLASELAAYAVDLGFSHVELLPLTEHPFGGSWGYQVTSYFRPTARFGPPDGLRELVDACHRAGLGVILDWVPGHFAVDDWGLAAFDGPALYEHPDPQLGHRPSWGTHVFDYGNSFVRGFLIASALYWLEEFHLDGLRVDAISSMIHLDFDRPAPPGVENADAVSFLRELTSAVRANVPGAIVIAEEARGRPGVTDAVALGGLGFDLTWDLGWTADALTVMAGKRQVDLSGMAHALQRAGRDRVVLPFSHDDAALGSLWDRMAGPHQEPAVRALLALMWASPGRKLLFMGTEFGQPGMWQEDTVLTWPLLENERHRGIHSLVRELNRRYQELPVLHGTDERAPEWLDVHLGQVFAFQRRLGGTAVVCVANFGIESVEGYELVMPWPGPWRVIMRSTGEDGPSEVFAAPAAGLHLRPLEVLWLYAEQD